MEIIPILNFPQVNSCKVHRICESSRLDAVWDHILEILVVVNI